MICNYYNILYKEWYYKAVVGIFACSCIMTVFALQCNVIINFTYLDLFSCINYFVLLGK